MVDCKNCYNTYEGNFCPECGQKASTKRFTTRILAKDLLKKIIPLDEGVLYTTWQLLRHPGPMVREYLDGKRVKYTKPLQYMLLIIAISLVFFSQQQFEQSVQAGYGATQNDASAQVSKQLMEFIFSHFTVVFLSIIPVLAFYSKLFYRKADVNYAEHLVLNTYLMAGCSLVSMPITILVKCMGQNPFDPKYTLLSLSIYLLFLAWAYVGFFKPRNPFLGGLKAILTFILAYISYTLLIGVLVGLGVAVYFSIVGK